MKEYQRATGNELDTFLIRNSKLKTQPELLDKAQDVDGNPVNPKGITRANEMSGAGIEYVTSLVEYVCTHHRGLIKETDSAIYYETVPIEWTAALDIMSNCLPGHRARAAKEILRLHAHPKPVLIKRKDGHMVSMQPFVMSFDWGLPETLDARAAANLARMQKGAEELAKKRELAVAKKEGRPVDVDSLEFPDLLPIEKITIQFSKPLFEDLMRNGGNTYTVPAGMYAQAFEAANYTKKLLIKDTIKNRETAFYLLAEKLDTEVFISAYTRYMRYLIKHNNLTTSEMKNKRTAKRIRLPVCDLIQSVYPSLYHIRGGGGKSLDRTNAAHFMNNAQAIYLSIPGFLIYSVLEGLDGDRFVYCQYTDRERAVKALIEQGK